jgi:hypothetical protein
MKTGDGLVSLYKKKEINIVYSSIYLRGSHPLQRSSELHELYNFRL